jgi:hypothetical protein
MVERLLRGLLATFEVMFNKEDTMTIARNQPMSLVVALCAAVNVAMLTQASAEGRRR